MGACATKPKDSNPEDLPEEGPATPKLSETVQCDDHTEKIDASENKDVEVDNKEEHLLDLSGPIPNNSPNINADWKAKSTVPIIDLTSKIDESKPQPGNSEKVPEVKHVEVEKAEVENVNTNHIKEVVTSTKDSEIVVTEVGKQKPDVKGDGPSPKSVGLDTKGVEMPLVST
ncbi:uncharacterized protein LOC131235371 [Magnolia sinica]|uniref:uncharacterized protein LOC131235371 n=1 Tax=Magnolia sinica TaxID=86752 RepID=UPI002658605E|nr:uncharacterized protein LOC131235371 [Magnolia sinica]